ncbi:MAG: glycoside hydrolase family 16 protein [Spirochaetales bacterium]|nr:glycoside hydrolase family 16 protein [Spirochaetales bacterium]
MKRKAFVAVLSAAALFFGSCNVLPEETPEEEQEIIDGSNQQEETALEIVWGNFRADPPESTTFRRPSGSVIATAEKTAALNEARDSSLHSESYFSQANSLEYIFTGTNWGGIYLQISESGTTTFDMRPYTIAEVALKGLEAAVGNMELRFEDPQTGQSLNLLDYPSQIDGEWEIYRVPLSDYDEVDFSRFNCIGLWHPGPGDSIGDESYEETTFLVDIQFDIVEIPADLAALITEANALNSSVEVGTITGQVSQSAKDAFTAAIAAAQAVLDSLAATQSDINNAAESLNSATAAFLESIISFNTTALSVEISEAWLLWNETLIGTGAGNVSQTDADLFEQAIAAAQNVVETAGSQSEVDNALAILQEAGITFREAIIADFTRLNEAIAKAETLNSNTVVGTASGNVSQIAKDDFTASIIQAGAVADDSGSTTVDIESALTDLTAATARFNIAIVADDPSDDYDPGSGWTPVWSDEFRYGAFDTDTWERLIPVTRFNDELQLYTGDASTAYVLDGNMILKAEHTGSGYDYGDFTSARVISNPGGSDGTSGSAGKLVRYGKLAARIKLPSGKGVWPAFWLLGDNYKDTGGDTKWPDCGEIDILESGSTAVNDGEWGHTTVGQAIHSTAGIPSSSNFFSLDAGLFSDNYHVFEIEWDSSQLVWKVDGTTVHTADISTIEEFHKDMYIIFNIAIGGSYTYTPDTETPFPLYMYIDWVRHYSQN